MSDDKKQPHLKLVVQSMDEQIKAGTIAELERLIEEVRNGEVAEVLSIISHNDGTWSHRAGPTTDILSWVGRIEATKLSLLDLYSQAK